MWVTIGGSTGVIIKYLLLVLIKIVFGTKVLNERGIVVYDKSVVDKSGEKWRKTWITYL